MNPYHQNKLFVDYHLQRAKEILNGAIPAPSTIEIDLTDGACNQACLHCFFDSNPSKSLNIIDPDLLLTFLNEAYGHGTYAFELVGGGEPTNHPKIAQIVARIAAMSHFDHDESPHIGLVTNGVLLNRIFPVIDKIEWIRISLDTVDKDVYNKLHGISSSSNHHNRVLDNIEQAVNLSGKDKIRIGYLVVPPFNHKPEQIRQAVSLANELGVKHIAFRPASLIGYETDSSNWEVVSRTIQEETQRYPDGFVLGGTGGSWDYVLGGKQQPIGSCRTRPLVLVIKADGTIPSCILFREKLDQRSALGHLSDGFTNVWFSESHKTSLSQIDRRTCPDVCKHFRADSALDILEENLPQGDELVLDPRTVDNPYFI